MAEDFERLVTVVRGWIEAAERVVALTGAGVSTDSGIPDFRGPQGVWTRNPEAEKQSTIQRGRGHAGDRGIQGARQPREDAIEMYYNASVTSWLNATLDLQVIEPALTKKLGSSGRLENADTAVVAGLRLYMRF